MIHGGEIDWKNVRRVLVVRLRSIGDTVLITPTLTALRRHLPEARIDVLLEDWVAPVLDGFDAVDEVLSFSKSSRRSRIAIAREIRSRRYDVVINLHGGTTSTFFTRVSGAPDRIGYAHYRYSFLYNHRLSSSAEFWGRPTTHSAEQHLALVGAFGIPVDDRPRTSLAVKEIQDFSEIQDSRFKIQDSSEIQDSRFKIQESPEIQDSRFKIQESESENPKSKIENPKSNGPKSKTVLLHPVAAFESKLWGIEKFAHVAEFLADRGFRVVAVGAPNEETALRELERNSSAAIDVYCDLTLPEITALAARCALFVGNDSGIAHIAAAVGCPSVVIFGSSSRDHWSPWTDAPHRVVYEPFDCQPCAGYRCEKFDSPRCIESVGTESVKTAIEEVLTESAK